MQLMNLKGKDMNQIFLPSSHFFVSGNKAFRSTFKDKEYLTIIKHKKDENSIKITQLDNSNNRLKLV